MNIVDLLLKLDSGKLTIAPTKKVRIRRLSEMAGEDVYFTVKAISGRRFTELSEQVYGEDGEAEMGKSYDANLMIAVEGIVEPDLRNTDLLKHYGCATPKDLAEKLLNGGEITKLSGVIADLSGYGKDKEAEIKNSSTRTTK